MAFFPRFLPHSSSSCSLLLLLLLYPLQFWFFLTSFPFNIFFFLFLNQPLHYRGIDLDRLEPPRLSLPSLSPVSLPLGSPPPYLSETDQG